MIQKKYLLRIFVIIFIFIIVFELAFSLTIYFYTNSSIKKWIAYQNGKTVYQIKKNTELIDDMIKSVSLSIFYNHNTVELLNTSYKEDEFFDDAFFKIYKNIEKIYDSFVKTNSFVHSVYFKNPNSKEIFSTGDDMLVPEAESRNLINQFKDIKKLKPYYHLITDKYGIDQPLFTYFMYDSEDMSSWIGLNVPFNWLFNSIESYNSYDNSDDESLILLYNGRVIDNKGNLSDELLNTVDGIMKEINYDDLEFNPQIIEEVIDGEKIIFSVMSLTDTGLVAMKIQNWDEVFDELNKLIFFILLITISIGIISLFISYYVASNIYKPVRDIFINLKNRNEDIPMLDMDEIEYIKTVQNTSFNTIQDLEKEISKKEELESIIYLRRLFLDHNKMQFTKIPKSVKIDNNPPLSIYLFKIDIPAKDFIFELREIISDLLKSDFFEVFDFKDNHFAILISGSSGLESVIDDFLTELSTLFNTFYYTLFKVESFSNIVERYLEARKILRYNYIYPDIHYITSDMIIDNERHKNLDDYFVAEYNVIEKLKSYNRNEITSSIDRLKNILTKTTIDEIKYCEIHLLYSIKHIIESINVSRMKIIDIDFNSYLSKVINYSSINNFFTDIKRLIEKILSEEKVSKNDKHTILAESIIKLIEERYTEPLFCLIEVADHFKSSDVYLGRIFKEIKGISIASYILDIRLTNAEIQLLHTSLTIGEIMNKTGFENESNFFRNFKKKYGSSPKQYRTKMVSYLEDE